MTAARDFAAIRSKGANRHKGENAQSRGFTSPPQRANPDHPTMNPRAYAAQMAMLRDTRRKAAKADVGVLSLQLLHRPSEVSPRCIRKI